MSTITELPRGINEPGGITKGALRVEYSREISAPPMPVKVCPEVEETDIHL